MYKEKKGVSQERVGASPFLTLQVLLYYSTLLFIVVCCIKPPNNIWLVQYWTPEDCI